MTVRVPADAPAWAKALADELERALAERDERIAELERRIEELGPLDGMMGML